MLVGVYSLAWYNSLLKYQSFGVEVLSVEISCLYRLLVYTDNDFHLFLGFN